MKKLCTFAGCNIVVDHDGSNTSPRCVKHKKRDYSQRKHYDHHYIDGVNIYKSSRWKHLRKAKLALNPLCEDHLLSDRAVPAQMVDHMTEIEDGGDPWSMNNLRSLCNACHNSKTSRVRQKRKKSKKEFPSLSDFK